MSRTRLTLLLIILLGIGLAVWIHERSTAAPAVPFAKVQRETLVSSLTTNAKIEPSSWTPIHAERAGLVERLAVHRGQAVRKGDLIAELTSGDARAEVAAGEAALAEARAQLETVLHGGTAQAKVDIANEIARNQLDLEAAQRDYEITKRLAAKQAATGQDLVDAGQRVERIKEVIAGLEKKRVALVDVPDRASAGAKVHEAEATLEQARLKLERSAIRAPMNGTVYDLPIRQGAFLNAGDPVASVGDVEKLQVRIQVDEPELGRVGVGMPVTVTWDALPGRQWQGTVEKMPTEVTPVGTRQVGVALATIDNPDLKLVPGTNVNVEVTSQVVAAGLTIPKEAIRTEGGKTGVYLLRDGRVEWRPIQLGASSITRAVVLTGLAERDQVALRTERPLHNGQPVRLTE
ncbi:MAG TPA: efflux RND transporter periplasmic adaptor subunit [Bryobacteraceae bacterium]|nr:efflux RND transporter periplasmic adaptor subunit [Bryobacteraceae bacterium]